MKTKLTRKEALGRIEEFFKGENFAAKDVKKIKRLAMKYNIKLGKHRRRFCKKCFFDLKNGSIRVSKVNKTIVCGECGEKNKFKTLN